MPEWLQESSRPTGRHPPLSTMSGHSHHRDIAFHADRSITQLCDGEDCKPRRLGARAGSATSQSWNLKQAIYL